MGVFQFLTLHWDKEWCNKLLQAGVKEKEVDMDMVHAVHGQQLPAVNCPRMWALEGKRKRGRPKET